MTLFKPHPTVRTFALLASLTMTVQAADPLRLSGTGATFPAPLYAKWAETYNKAHPEVRVGYETTGSGPLSPIAARSSEYFGSDARLSEDREKALPAKILHIPTVGGPLVMIYNLPGITGLKLNGDIISNIYLGTIKRWNDPKLTTLNSDLKLPDIPITVVHRSDGSGTTFIFTDYLSKISADWKAKPGKGTTVQWPVGLGSQGGAGIAVPVRNTEGTIGYIEWAFAVSQKMPFATLLNKDGKEVAPSVASVQAAAANALQEFAGDFKVSITDAPGTDSYPICGFTFLLVYEDLSYLKDKPNAQALADFLLWCETDGQKMAGELGYAALPKPAQEKVVARLKTITFDGEALLR